ncbi:hypothetical protein K3Z84_28920, partial [Pseudomonas aeruginosa]|nr:hypothetical protein [Pseudomonas aeruginosa]
MTETNALGLPQGPLYLMTEIVRQRERQLTALLAPLELGLHEWRALRIIHAFDGDVPMSVLIEHSQTDRTALDFQGRRYGQVVDGGSIVIGGTVEHASGKADAAELFIDLLPGSLLDASGTQALLDVPGVGQTRVSSAGGSISLASANGLYLDGDLRAFAGGEGAAAGSL